MNENNASKNLTSVLVAVKKLLISVGYIVIFSFELAFKYIPKLIKFLVLILVNAFKKGLNFFGKLKSFLLEKAKTVFVKKYTEVKTEKKLTSELDPIHRIDDVLLANLKKINEKSNQLDDLIDNLGNKIQPLKVTSEIKNKLVLLNIGDLIKKKIIEPLAKLINKIKSIKLPVLKFSKKDKMHQEIVKSNHPMSSFVLLESATQKFKQVKAKATITPKQKGCLSGCSSFLLGMIFTFLFIIVPFNLYSWYRAIPKPELLSQRTPNLPTKILDRKGRLLYEIYVDKRYEPVPLDKIPDQVIKATLAIEDNDFYSHHGIRLKSIIRAAKATLFEDNLQGGSTITQQLVKNVLLSPERTITRKVKEIVLSLAVEAKYTKNQILEMYLNNIPYGGTSWGIQAASQKFFGKDVGSLNLAEASMLAGLPSAPSVYSPFIDETMAKQRQMQVLDRMVDLKYISQEQADSAFNEQLTYATQSEYIRAPHFVHYVRDQLEEMYGKRFVDFGGLTVVTTLDLDLQDKAQTIVKEEVLASKNLNFNNGAAVVIDNRYRGILAYVGSIDYFLEGYGAYDLVGTAYRQPGSSIKPVTYALSFEKGYTPATILDDSPTMFQTYNQIYKPVNYDGRYHGKVSIRSALANSYNIPAVKVVKYVTPDAMVLLGSKMGLSNWKVDGSYGLSVTLGGKEVRLLDLANVYATFSSNGTAKEVTPFLSIKDVYGYDIYNPDSREVSQPLSDGAAYLITSILSDNNARTPAFGSRNSLIIPGHTVAVKTGTTDSKRDNWTFGYTPSYTVGVWVGNNDNTPMNPYLASGLTGAAPIWNKIFTAVLEGTPNEPFIIPDSVFIMVDPACGNRSEVFIKGSNIPKNLCVIEKDKDKDKKDEKKKKDD